MYIHLSPGIDQSAISKFLNFSVGVNPQILLQQSLNHQPEARRHTDLRKQRLTIIMDIWLQNSIEPFAKFDKGHSNSIETLQFSPTSANELATGSHDKLVKIWDVNKLKEMGRLSSHKEGIWSLCYSMDGKSLFSGSPDKSILVWDLKSGKTVSSLKEHKNKIYWVSASDNGLFLASGGQDGHIIVWDMRKLKILKDIQASMDIIYCINYTQQSQYFFSGDSTGLIKAHESQKVAEVASTKPRVQREKIHAIQSIKTDNNGFKLLVGQKNKSVAEYTFETKTQTFKKVNEAQVHFDGVHALALDRQKERFATGSRDGTARVWSLKRKDETYEALINLLGHKQRVTQVEFHQTNKILATCSWDQNIHLYKV